MVAVAVGFVIGFVAALMFVVVLELGQWRAERRAWRERHRV